MKRRRNTGYSLAEVVVSMALVAMILVFSFGICISSMKVQNDSFDTVQMISVAEIYRDCFHDAIVSQASGNEEKQINLIDAFTQRLSFGFGIEELNEAYEREIRTYWTGSETYETIVSSKYYVWISYCGNQQPKRTIVYVCENGRITVTCVISFIDDDCRLTVDGQLKHTEHETYRYEEHYKI